MLYKSVFACTMLLFPFFVQSQNLDKITLQEAVDLTLSNNLQIKQAALEVNISEETLKQTKLERLPVLNGSSSASRQFGLFFDQTSGTVVQQADQVSGNLSTSVNLFQGFALKNRILQNKVTLAADNSNLNKIKNDLTLSVITTYLQALANQDLVLASKEQLNLALEQLNIADKNFKVGNNTLADLSQAKSLVANNELSLTNAQNAYDIALLDLKQFMEMGAEKEVELEAPDVKSFTKLYLDYRANEVFAEAVKTYPDIKLAEQNTEVLGYGIKIAKANLYPSLSFGGGYGTSYSSILSNSFGTQLKDNINKYLGLQLNIPIFNGYKSRSAVNIAKIRYENGKISEQLAKNNLSKVINQAVLDLKAADKKYYATKSAFDSSKDAFEVIKKRYEVGLVSTLDLNTSQTNFNKAQFDFIQAKYDLIFRSKIIDFYLGNPISL